MSENRRRELIDVAAGRKPAELVLKNAHIVNVVSHEIHDGNLAVHRGRIVGFGDYAGEEEVDLKDRYLCPGFIDAHVHIESSLLAVPEFARVVLPHGTTTVITDPHEFANVMGAEGISYVLKTAKRGPLTVYVMLSSCVPASPMESAGAILTDEDLEPFLANPWVLGLAEMMNYPGVIAGEQEVLSKIEIASDRVVDGHAPMVEGNHLTAYVVAGIMSDHECITAEEARDKLRRGLHIMIREGSQTRNLTALAPLVKPENAHHFMFCTDDKDVRDLIEEGQIDFMIQKAVSLGMDPVLAIRLGTYNTARYFGLRRTGALLPGYRGDIAVLDNLEDCRVVQVYRRGQLVAENGQCLLPYAAKSNVGSLRSSINIHLLEQVELAIPAPAETTADHPPHIHVIEVLENRIDTERSIEAACVREGQFVADPTRDLAKIAVIERHRASGQIGFGFARGFKLRDGALGSSIAHDAHNLITVGTNDDDMFECVRHLVKLRGGLVVVRGGRVLADVPLPIAGLVTDVPAETAAEQLCALTEAAKDLGCEFDQPFMALSFLSLSVIGKLKVTNLGLMDVEKFEVIELVAPLS